MASGWTSCCGRTGVYFFSFLLLLALIASGRCEQEKKEENAQEKWKKKDIRDYNDADLERLFDQWEEADEPLEEDELPEWKRPQPKIDMSKLDANDPEGMLKHSKQGRTLMMFATVSGNPSERETEQISQLWQSSLFNAHYELQRYVVGSNRVLFSLKDGSKAWEIKDFLVSQGRCEVVTIEGQDFPGKGAGATEKPQKTSSEDNKTKKKKSKKNKKKTEESEKKLDDLTNDTSDYKKPKPVRADDPKRTEL